MINYYCIFSNYKACNFSTFMSLGGGGGGGGGASRLVLSAIVGVHPDINILFYVIFWPYLKQSTCVYILSLYFPYLYFVVTCHTDKINKYLNCKLCMQIYRRNYHDNKC